MRKRSNKTFIQTKQERLLDGAGTIMPWAGPCHPAPMQRYNASTKKPTCGKQEKRGPHVEFATTQPPTDRCSQILTLSRMSLIGRGSPESEVPLTTALRAGPYDSFKDMCAVSRTRAFANTDQHAKNNRRGNLCGFLFCDCLAIRRTSMIWWTR
jgi:hypothetical protein